MHRRYHPLMEINFVESNPGPGKSRYGGNGSAGTVVAPAASRAATRQPGAHPRRTRIATTAGFLSSTRRRKRAYVGRKLRKRNSANRKNSQRENTEREKKSCIRKLKISSTIRPQPTPKSTSRSFSNSKKL